MPETPITALAEHAIKQSIQELPDAKNGSGNLIMFGRTQRGPLLPAWGSRDRERALRWLYRHDYNWMVQGAFSGIMNTIASTPWEIKGPDDVTEPAEKHYRTMLKALGKEPATDRPDVEYWQALLRNADFGRGWTSFIRKGVDFLRQDSGWFIEIIAPGDPRKPPTGAVTGLAHLDALRCYPTGDPIYPVIYYDSKGGYHLLHTSRVIQMVDMPDGDEIRPGYGLCALSRAVSIASQGILMGRYIETKLDDKPAPGITVFSGMIETQMQTAVNRFRDDQSMDEQPPYGKQLTLFSIDPAMPIKVETTAFTQAPDKFDYKQYTELDIDALALAIGVDKQDLWQMTTGSMGSSGQSMMAAQKSRGKTIGVFRTELERVINDLLPDEYEFKWTAKDPQQEIEKAQNAQAWSTVATSLKGTLGPDEIRQLLASQVEAVKDAITDEEGNIRTVDDAGIQPPQVLAVAPAPEATVTADDAKPNAPVQGGGGAAESSGIDRPVRKGRGMDVDVGGLGDVDTRQKAIQATRLDFEADFADLITARVADKLTGARFGILARAQLKKYGLQAMRDGLEDGGVRTFDENGIPMPLEPDEQAAFESWLIEQSIYVTNLGRDLRSGIIPNAEDRAGIWANKSLMAMYDEGRNSANENAMLEFVGDDGDNTCTTCARLKGQRHRSKDWKRRKMRPQIDTENFVCGGWQCKHTLQRTSLPAKGRF